MKEDVSNRAARHFTIICAHGDGIFSQTFSINSGRGFKSAVHSKKSMPGDSQGFIRNEKANKLIEVN